MAIINTEQIDKIADQLDAVADSLDGMFADLQKQIDNAGSQAQSIIDKAGEDASAKLNEKLAIIKEKIIEIFKPQIEKIKEKIAPIEPILDMFPIDISLSTSCLTAIVDALKAIADIITAPYQPYIEILTTLPPSISKLTSAMSRLANYQPSLKLPQGVNPPEIKVNVTPITPGDIM